MPEPAELLIVEPIPSGLALAGEIDALTAPLLTAALEAADQQPLVIDMGRVEFCDSSGLRVLLEAHQRLADEGRKLLLARPSEVVARLLDVAGVREHLGVIDPVADDEADAIDPDAT